MGDEHRVAARQVLVAWSGSGHDQVLYKGEKEKLMLRKCTAHKVEQLSLFVRLMSQSFLTRKDFLKSLAERTTGSTVGRYILYTV